MNRRDFLKMAAAAAAFGAMGSLGISKLMGMSGESYKNTSRKEDRMQSSERQQNRQDALAEAQKQLDSGLIQGVVFADTRNKKIEVLGKQRIHPVEKMMTPDSRFDMASTGKVFTAGCCALLIVRGELDPDKPFVHYLPEYWDHGSDITIRDLAMHVSGFDNSKPYDSADPEVFWRELFNKRPVRPRLQAFEYACSNLILLGKIAEKISGMDLETLARRLIWEPLGMKRTDKTQ